MILTAEQIQALLNGATPGPWFANHANGEVNGGLSGGYPIVWDYGDYDKATACAEMGDEDAANLSLIAAAPDLADTALAALAERDALLSRHKGDREELDRLTADGEARHEQTVALQARVKALKAGLTLAVDIAESWIHDQLDGTSGLESELASLEPARALLKGQADE